MILPDTLSTDETMKKHRGPGPGEPAAVALTCLCDFQTAGGKDDQSSVIRPA